MEPVCRQLPLDPFSSDLYLAPMASDTRGRAGHLLGLAGGQTHPKRAPLVQLALDFDIPLGSADDPIRQS